MSPELTVCVLYGCVIVEVWGEVDLSSVPALERHLSAVIASAVIAMQASAIVLDLSRLLFIDCAGLRVLLDAERRAAARGKSFALAAPRRIVARLLETTGLDQHFIAFPTVAEAVVAAVSPPC